MDLDFFFGTPAAAPTKPPPQPAAASGGFDFFAQQQPQGYQQQQQQPQVYQQQQQQPQAYSHQQAYQQPFGQPNYPPQPYSQPSFSPNYPAQQSGYGSPQLSSQPFAASPQQSAFYAAPTASRQQQSGMLPQPAQKPANNNNEFFDMFGGDFLGGKPAPSPYGGKPAPSPQAQQPQPIAQPQTVQFSNDDFFEMLGGSSAKASPQPATQPSKPSPAPVQATQATQTTQASTFKRGQAKKDAAGAKKDLNLDAFSQLAVSRQKAPAVAAAPSKKPVESESESESESEDDDDSVKGPKNIDDDEQQMGTGQGFSPMDHARAGGGGGGGGGVLGSAKKCVAADCNNTFQGAGRYCAAHHRYETNPPESKDADGRKVKGEWSIERKRTGTKMGFIKNITIWKFYFKGEQHTIELRHSTFSGKRVILVDRRQLLSEKRLIGGDAAHKVFAGSDFETRCEVTVVIKSNNDRFQYGIFIEGLPIRDAKLKYAEYI